MKASRRSRGAREMEKEREKREAEKRNIKKKEETRAPRPHHRQPCRLHPRAKLRFAFGLRVGKRQQDGRSGGRWPAKLGGRSWLVEDCGAGMERMVAGSSGRLAPEGNVLTGGKHRVL